MSGRVRYLNIALGLMGCLLAAGLVRELLAAHPLPPPPPPRAARPIAAPAPAVTPTVPTAAYGVIVAKNLFSPSRSEAPAGPVVAAGPKPVLHGVVMDGPKSRAYLEDPVAKRTFGYLVGDTIGGGRVESIAADRVVIGRGDGLVEVLLHDPSKPRSTPSAPAPTAGPSGGTSQAGPAPTAPAPPVPAAPAAGPRPFPRVER
jgi:hypothetical protein